MPVQYVIYPKYRLVVTTGENQVTFEEVRSHQDKLLNDPDFRSEFNQLMDGIAIRDFELSSDQIRMIVNRRVFSPTSRRALLVGSTFLYGMGRMLQTYLELSKAASPTNVFYDRASALKWLGIPEDSGLF
jgi:hypothetical protein